MKIRLIVVQSEGKFPDLKVKYSTVETIAEANKIEKNCIDRETYSLIKAFGENSLFVSIVNGLRAEFHIPENGYGIEAWNLVKQKHKKDASFSKWRSQVELKSIRKLTEAISIHPLLVTSLPEIVLLGCMFVPIPKIFIETPYTLYPNHSYSAIKIVINSKVSRNQLLKFIDEHWLKIESDLNQTDGAELYISDRDYRIVGFRDKQKLQFGEIADLLASEKISENANYTDEAKFNEDSMKRAYHEAKRKINTLKR